MQARVNNAIAKPSMIIEVFMPPPIRGTEVDC